VAPEAAGQDTFSSSSSSDPEVTPLMKTTARAVAENYLLKGAPIKAACTLLAINDTQVRNIIFSLISYIWWFFICYN